MSGADEENVGLNETDVDIVRRLLEAGRSADEEDGEVAGTTKVAQLLIGQIVSSQMMPFAMKMVLDRSNHPLFARRFAALDINGRRQGWSRQEERLLARFVDAQERVTRGKIAREAAEKILSEAEEELESISIDMALMRLAVMLRSMQDFIRPALDAGPLLTVALAVLGKIGEDDERASPEAREAAKETFEVLARRIDDGVFVDALGGLIREFAKAYEAEVGSERRLSVAAAKKLCDQLLAQGVAARKLAELASGNEAAVMTDIEFEGSEELAQTGSSTAQAKPEPDKPVLPF